MTKNKKLIILNILLVFIVIIITMYKPITNHHYIDGDIRYLTFINNFPDSVNNNLIAKYSFGNWVTTTIYLSHFYIFIDSITNFILISKLVGIFAFILSIIYIYKLGIFIKNKKFGLILTFLFALNPWILRPFSSGLSKAFGFPLLIIFMYYLIKKSSIKLSLALILSALLYPPVFLINVLIFGLSLLNFKLNKLINNIKQNLFVIFFIILSFSFIIIPLQFYNFGLNERYSFEELVLFPELYEGGSSNDNIFKKPIPFTTNLKSTIGTIIEIFNPGISRPIYASPLFILFLLSLILTITYREKILKLPKEIYLIPIASIILQVLAFILLFRLHLPSRYVRFSLPIFLIIILAHGIYFLSLDKRYKIILKLLFLFLITFYLSQLITTPEWDPALCNDIKLYDFIERLPTNVIIAGYPDDMGCIGLFGKKDPFVLGIIDEPFHKDFYEIIKKRNIDFFTAYFSDSKQSVLEFCKSNNVSHIIVNNNHFTPKFLSQDKIYGDPYDVTIKKQISNNKDFYLSNPNNILFSEGNKLVVNCS